LRIVVDANFLVSLAIPTPVSSRAALATESWLAAQADLFAPALWSYEAVSAIRKYVASGKLSQEEAFQAVTHLLAVGVQDIPASEELHHMALAWAERLGNFVAYDSAYLALAEHLDAPLWTVDGKLARKVKALGIEWVHDLAEEGFPG
jgi:predicted nucleic acid-binding protein